MLDYLLYPPSESEPPQPLILFLHGSGERGDDLDLVKRWSLPRFLEEGGRLPAYVAAPQCPGGNHWEDMLERLDALRTSLMAQYAIDPDRVYLMGFSLGGFGVWNWAMASPNDFAAILPVAGSGAHPGTGVAPDIRRIKHVPVWMVHSGGDETVDVSGADSMAVRMAAEGMPYGYTRYPDYTHAETSDAAFGDMNLYNWLLRQSRKSGATP